jgi:hypothetical protein
VTAERGGACRLQPGHSASDDDDSSRRRGRGELGERRVADARIHRAPHWSIGVQPADAALVESDAGPRGPTDAGLRGQLGVGDDRARHRDQVDAAGHARVRHGGLHVAPSHHDRNADRLAEAPRALVIHALRQLVTGHEVLTRQPRRARAPAHAEQVDRPARRQAARHVDQLVGTQSAGQALIDRHPEPDDEVLGHRSAHGFQHLAAKAGAVLQTATVLVRARVDAGVEELLDQVPAERRHLATVPAAPLQACRRVREPLHDRRDLRNGERHRHLEVDTLRKVGWCAQRDACHRGRAAPPHVRHLRDAAGTVAVDAVGQRSKRRLVALLPKCDRAIRRCRRGVHRGRAERHHESASTGRLAHVIVHLAPIDQTVAAPTRRVGRRHDPVAQHPPAQLQRRIQMRKRRRTLRRPLQPFAGYPGHLRRPPLRPAA